MKGWQQVLAKGDDDPATVSAANRVFGHTAPLPTLPQILKSEFVADLWRCDNYSQWQQEAEEGEELYADFASERQRDLADRMKAGLLKTRLAAAARKRK